MAQTWTREAVVEAIQEWTVTRGRPPASRDWCSGVPGFPTAETVRQRFGSFKTAREAAGVQFRRRNHIGDWSREEIVAAIFRWTFDHGQPPRAKDWVLSVDGNPTEWWVRRRFGTWNAAIVAAGYQPRCPRRTTGGYAAVSANALRAAA